MNNKIDELIEIAKSVYLGYETHATKTGMQKIITGLEELKNRTCEHCWYRMDNKWCKLNDDYVSDDEYCKYWEPRK